jgi:hypothetical protein
MGHNSRNMAAVRQTPKAWRRVLGAAGGALARLLERAVPAMPPQRTQSGLPPEIRFPFF